MAIQHKDITDPDIHEVKGASVAVGGQLLVANGDGTASFQTINVGDAAVGFYVYHDTGTSQALTSGTYSTVTNDMLNVRTRVDRAIAGATTVWSSITNRFGFTTLQIGDLVNITAHLSVTTTNVNTGFDAQFESAMALPTANSIAAGNSFNVKTASTIPVILRASFPILTSDDLSGPARFKIKPDAAGASMSVNQFIVEVLRSAG